MCLCEFSIAEIEIVKSVKKLLFDEQEHQRSSLSLPQVFQTAETCGRIDPSAEEYEVKECWWFAWKSRLGHLRYAILALMGLFVA